MKRLFVLVGCISLILFSCYKNQNPDLKSRQKQESAIPGSKRVAFRVTDIYSTISSIKRRIDVISQRTNSVLGKMFITVSCNDPNDDLHKKINYHPENFSGVITLESSHLIKFTKRIINGKLVKVETQMFKDHEARTKGDIESDPESDPDSKENPDSQMGKDAICSMLSIAECANTAMGNLNWLDYAFCALQINFCLLKNFGICAGQICK